MSKQLTVAELIKLLETVEDKTKVIITEGCDCYGDAGSIVENEYSVSIERVL